MALATGDNVLLDLEFMVDVNITVDLNPSFGVLMAIFLGVWIAAWFVVLMASWVF